VAPLTPTFILNGIWWNIKSVLFEELTFRGVLFYILISSIAFGIYQWVSQEAFGNVSQMLLIFILTGIMGLIYAYGYVKTGSLFVPCAIHLGWNITQGFIFSQGSTGNGILVLVKDQPEVSVSYLIYFTILLTPILSAWVLNFLILKKRNEVFQK
jgi:membrane protease YdiL (CAAX protease family)